MGPSAQGLPSLRRLWGRTHSHVHLGCWQKAVPSSLRIEDQFTSWMSARGLPAFPIHPSPCSSPLLLPVSAPRQGKLSAFKSSHDSFCTMILSAISLITVTSFGHQGGTSWVGRGGTLEILLTRPPYLYFLLRKLLNASALLLSKQEIEIGSLLPLSKSDFK